MDITTRMQTDIKGEAMTTAKHGVDPTIQADAHYILLENDNLWYLWFLVVVLLYIPVKVIHMKYVVFIYCTVPLLSTPKSKLQSAPFFPLTWNHMPMLVTLCNCM